MTGMRAKLEAPSLFSVQLIGGARDGRRDVSAFNALRSRRINGQVYIRKEDVVKYLRDTDIADRLSKVQS